MVDLDKDRLQKAPSYTGSQDPTWNRAYGSQIDSYYGVASDWDRR